MSAEIKPFQVSVPDEALNSLRDRLSSTKYFDEVEFSNDWSYGAPLSNVKRLAKYWADGFDWRAEEAKMNKLPQFTTVVNVDQFGELDMHFVHQRSSRPGAIPLLFCHGCEP